MRPVGLIIRLFWREERCFVVRRVIASQRSNDENMETMYKAFIAYAAAYAAYGRAYRAARDDEALIDAANQSQQAAAAAWETFQHAAGGWQLDIGLLCIIQNALWHGLPVRLVDTLLLLCQSSN